MEISSVNPSQVKDAVSVEVLKKSEDVVKNQIGKILEDNFEQTMKIQQEAAAATGAGVNINVQG
ncbi:MAG: shikimate kinase [Epsilonproteobacteria bacterium]|nr:shikimate kinase [Campylobacterota bacterium]